MSSDIIRFSPYRTDSKGRPDWKGRKVNSAGSYSIQDIDVYAAPTGHLSYGMLWIATLPAALAKDVFSPSSRAFGRTHEKQIDRLANNIALKTGLARRTAQEFSRYTFRGMDGAFIDRKEWGIRATAKNPIRRDS